MVKGKNTQVGAEIGDNPFGSSVLGVIRLEGWGDPQTTGTGDTGYVPIRGDIDDQRSLDFPAVASIAKGCSWDNLKDPSKWNADNNEAYLSMIQEGLGGSFKECIQQGADVIVANCGLFMWCHAKNIVPKAMNDAMAALKKEGINNPRPIVQLSTLTYLSCMLPLYGIGPSAEVQSPVPKIAIFTSNEEACLAILKATPELEGVKFFVHSDSAAKKKAGEVFVVGLNGDNVVGVNGTVDGFEIVNDGTPAFYDKLQPSMKKVAQGVKKEYPDVVMGIVECTEVGAYTDTIRHELECPVYDPIHLTETGMDAIVDHEYKQVGNAKRTAYIDTVLALPVNVNEKVPYYIDVVDGDDPGDPEEELEDKKGNSAYSEKELANYRLKHLKNVVAKEKKNKKNPHKNHKNKC